MDVYGWSMNTWTWHHPVPHLSCFFSFCYLFFRLPRLPRRSQKNQKEVHRKGHGFVFWRFSKYMYVLTSYVFKLSIFQERFTMNHDPSWFSTSFVIFHHLSSSFIIIHHHSSSFIIICHHLTPTPPWVPVRACFWVPTLLLKHEVHTHSFLSGDGDTAKAYKKSIGEVKSSPVMCKQIIFHQIWDSSVYKLDQPSTEPSCLQFSNTKFIL